MGKRACGTARCSTTSVTSGGKLSSMGAEEATVKLQTFQRERDVILASINLPGAGSEALNVRCAKEAYEVEGRQYAAA